MVVALFSGKLVGVRVAVVCVKSKFARAAPVSDFALPFAFLASSMALAIIEEAFMDDSMTVIVDGGAIAEEFQISGLLDQDYKVTKVGEVACEG